MISSYRRYTASEIEAANNADLPELLASLGYHVKPAGRYYTTQEMDSLRIWDRRREPEKVCVKENKRHPFSQELEQETNLIERMYQ